MFSVFFFFACDCNYCYGSCSWSENEAISLGSGCRCSSELKRNLQQSPKFLISQRQALLSFTGSYLLGFTFDVTRMMGLFVSIWENL